MSVIGIDTSNYTTSIAFFDGEGGENCSRLLPVRQGELGLRQSDAVFAHIKSLPELSGRLFSHIQKDAITAVGVSTRPRAVEGSYMPCFMVGYSHAKLLSDALGVPLIEVSHQQGHVAASLWSAGRMDLLEKPHPHRRHHGHFRRSADRPDGAAFGAAVPIGQASGQPQPGSDGEGCVPRQVQELRIFPFRRAE